MLIFNMIVVRVFSESLYGTYKQANLIMNLTTSIFILGIPTTISYFYVSYDKLKREKLIGNTIILLLSISIITSFLLIFFKESISLFLNNHGIVNYVNIIAIYITVMIVSSFLENLYISSDNSILLGKIYVVYVVINFIAMAGTAIFTKDLNMLLKIMALIEAIRTIIMYFAIKKSEDLKIKADLKLLISQLRFSIPLGVVAIVQNLNMYIDNIFISNRYTTEQYAAYSNAAADIPLVGIITVSIATVVLPKMSRAYKQNNNYKEILDIWGDSCIKTALLMFPIFWIALFFSREYIEIIFSSRYVASSTPIFIIYLLKFPLYFTVFGNILIALGEQKYTMVNSLIGMILNIILNTIFIELFGMKGPAISTVIIQYFVVYLLLRKTSKITGISIKNILPYKKIMELFILPLFISLPLFFISTLLDINVFIKFMIFGILIYLLTIMLYGKRGYFDIKKIKDIIKKRVNR